ncbi:PAS domain S-box [Archaeoglobus sulfaticallidus PM70-1]|uniref:histidine kinase n=1 Tax=Archaeoglobus sulfaticallidus PM70-1 TaxID=387631 RepID=N0BH44_9EURY|nr:PAS domain S-box [Archaeoglobus sulfaticallidus PM70-1]
MDTPKAPRDPTIMDLELLKEFIDFLPFYVILVDEEHRILLVNTAFEQEFNLRLEEARGKFCPQLIHGVERFPGCPLDEALKCNCPSVAELFDDRSEKWVKSAVYPTNYIYNGKRIFIHFTWDITDKKKAELDLERSRKLYMLIFENTGNATILVEGDRIVLANKKFVELSGYSKEEIEGKLEWRLFVHKDDLDKMEKFNRLRYENPKEAPREFEIKFVDRKGRIRHVLVSAGSISKKDPSTIVLSLTDLTERKILEEQKDEAYKIIDQNIEEFAILVDHIRNPLAIIQGIAEMRLEGMERDIILKQIDRIESIVRRLDEGWIQSEKIRKYLRES